MSEFSSDIRKEAEEWKELKVEKRIIAFDGVDGSGKSTLAQMLVDELNKRGKEAILVKFNLKGGGEGEERIRKIIEEKNPSDEIVSGLVAAGINRAYGEQIMPALSSGKIVVLDRSEIDLLRFSIERNDQNLFGRRLRYIKEGLLTHGLWAGNRVYVDMAAEDVWRNLEGREVHSRFDPNNLVEVTKRITAQGRAEELAENIQCNGDVNIVRVTNVRSDNYREYLSQLVDEIYSRLKM